MRTQRGIVATALRRCARGAAHADCLETPRRLQLYEMASRVLWLLGADHGCHGSCARVARSWPITWVGLDNDHLAVIATDDRTRLNDRACGNCSDVIGNTVRRVTAIAWVAQPGASARWRVRGQYVGKALETCGR